MARPYLVSLHRLILVVCGVLKGDAKMQVWILLGDGVRLGFSLWNWVTSSSPTPVWHAAAPLQPSVRTAWVRKNMPNVTICNLQFCVQFTILLTCMRVHRGTMHCFVCVLRILLWQEVVTTRVMWGELSVFSTHCLYPTWPYGLNRKWTCMHSFSHCWLFVWSDKPFRWPFPGCFHNEQSKP